MGDLNLLQPASMSPLAISFLIFLARICDVSLGTIRIIVVGRGMRWTASLLGFVEVLIWLMAIGMVMQNLHGWLNFVMYAAGFATGTFVGMTIERRFEMGQVLVRVIASEHGAILVEHLTALGLRVTHIDGHSGTGPVGVIFSVVRRKQLRRVIDLIHQLNPEAFYSVEDVRDAAERPAPIAALSRPPIFLQPFFWFRKSK